MKVNAGFKSIRVGAVFCATLILSIAAQPASAQSLAQEFNAILNGPQGVAAQCRAANPNGVGQCNIYGITPTTDLQMRFAAPEENAAQKSAVKEFSSQQLKGIATRLGTLRVRTADARTLDAQRALYADNAQNLLGGGAAASPESGGVGAFSGFATLSHGFGSRDQTGYEDNADYTGNDLLVGADYRISPSLVFGLALGYTDKTVDLTATYSDATTPPTTNASGSTDANGYGVTAYFQWESDSFYANASLGYQQLDYDLERRADYVTGAPTVPLTAKASTKGSGPQVSASLGYVFAFGGTSIDAAVNAQYQDVSIDGFQETGALCTTGACAGADLNMRFAEQTLKSLETSLSVRVQHAFSSGAGVFIPFVSAEYIEQMEDDPFVISGMYVPFYGSIANFNLNTDVLDTTYYGLGAGLSWVGQGGWQAFLRYRTTLELENVSDSTVALGVRYEF